LESLFISNSCEGIYSGAIGFFETPFENVGNLIFISDFDNGFGYSHRHIFAFYGAWTSY